MANKEISELTVADAIAGVELLHIVQSGNSRRTTLAEIAAYARAGENMLINPLGTINQRAYASGAATTAANQYTLDRWRVVVSGQSLAWTETENVRTITAPAGGVEQIIEGLSLISGTYTLAWEGTATATIGGATVANGGQAALTGGVNATIRFSGGTFKKPKLEFGSEATVFRPRSIEDEEASCARFYRNMDGALMLITGSAAAANANRQFLSPTMRGNPTITFTPASGTGAAIVATDGRSIRQSGLNSADAIVTTLRLDAELA